MNFKSLIFLVLIVACYLSLAATAFAQETTPTPEPGALTNTLTPEPPPADPSAGSRGNTLFFSEEALRNTLPSGLQEEFMPQGKQSEIELKGAKLRKCTNLPGDVCAEDKDEPRPPQNVFEIIKSWFLKLFLPRAVKKEGFVQFIRPNDQPFTNQKDASKQDESDESVYQGAVIDTERSFTPEGISFSRYPVSFPDSAISIQSTKLKEIFLKASETQCVPIGVILAISRRELDKTFGYSDQEVEHFSSNEFPKNATYNDLLRVSCTNTCELISGCAPGDDVRGPMQFEEKTWNGHIATIKSALKQEYSVPDEYIPDRCNLRDAIIGAAIKMKANSGTGGDECSLWTDTTVRQVAEGYCGKGACSDHPACGVGYCDAVTNLYHRYSDQNSF